MSLNYDDLDREIERDLGIKPPRGASVRKFWEIWGPRLSPFLLPCRWLWAFLRFPLVPTLSLAASPRHPHTKSSFLRRFAEAFLTRLVLTPFILAAFFLLLVWYSTHPAPVLARQTPAAVGLYYRSVSLVSIDGQHLQAWYIPGFTTEEFIRNGDDALRDRRPGVVLVHGLGLSHDQYLTLASRLHEAGFCVLMLSCRGQGESEPGAVTFGLRERNDVLAAITYLRDLPQVDASRLCLVGYGMGATAVLQAALNDTTIAAVVAESPWPSFGDWTRRSFDAAGVAPNLLSTLYQMAFELAYRERASQMELDATLRHLGHTSLLLVAHNQPGEAPAASLLAAAQGMPGPHQVLVLDPTDSAAKPARLAAAITTFLAESTRWTPADQRLSNNLKKLIESRVK